MLEHHMLSLEQNVQQVDYFLNLILVNQDVLYLVVKHKIDYYVMKVILIELNLLEKSK